MTCPLGFSSLVCKMIKKKKMLLLKLQRSSDWTHPFQTTGLGPEKLGKWAGQSARRWGHSTNVQCHLHSDWKLCPVSPPKGQRSLASSLVLWQAKGDRLSSRTRASSRAQGKWYGLGLLGASKTSEPRKSGYLQGGPEQERANSRESSPFSQSILILFLWGPATSHSALHTGSRGSLS